MIIKRIIYEKQKTKCFKCGKKIKNISNVLVNEDNIYCKQCGISNINGDSNTDSE